MTPILILGLIFLASHTCQLNLNWWAGFNVSIDMLIGCTKIIIMFALMFVLGIYFIVRIRDFFGLEFISILYFLSFILRGHYIFFVVLLFFSLFKDKFFFPWMQHFFSLHLQFFKEDDTDDCYGDSVRDLVGSLCLSCYLMDDQNSRMLLSIDQNICALYVLPTFGL